MLQQDRGQRKQPFVLQVRDPRRGIILAAASALARQRGVVPGMSLSEAKALGEMIVEPYDAEEDLEGLCSLAELGQQFSPVVGLETLDSKIWSGRSLHQPQGLLFDITHLAPLFQGEEALAGLVADWLVRQGLVGIIAVASSVGTAWAMANYSYRTQAAQMLLHQNSLETLDFEQIIPPVIVPAMTLDQAMREPSMMRLPIESLRLDVETVRGLHRLGIFQIESLLALPRDGLAARFGKGLLQRVDQMVAGLEEPILSLHAQADFQVQYDLEYATDRRETLEELLRRLTRQLCEQLARRDHGALRWICRLDALAAPARVLQLNLFRASSDADHLIPLVLSQMEQQWDRPLQIHRVVAQATLVAPLAWQQPDLFQAAEVVHRNAMARLIDSLSCRLGRRSVVTPCLHRDPQPELACSWRPLTGRRPSGQPQTTHRKLSGRSTKSSSPLPTSDNHQVEPLPQDPMRRPVRLVHPPEPLGLSPCMSTEPSNPPSTFSWNGRGYQVFRFWGPERIESGWWRGPSQRRDYYRIETDQGAWLWIFQCLPTQRWFLHGEFD